MTRRTPRWREFLAPLAVAGVLGGGIALAAAEPEAQPTPAPVPSVPEVVPSAPGAAPVPSPTPSISKGLELVPRAKLVKAVRARDAARAQVRALRREVRELRALTTLTPTSNRELGRRLAAERGWTGGEWSALDALWSRESGWRSWALNTDSGACHIPQALPCSKIPGGLRASVATAVRWGLGYIGGRYGRPSTAWAHSQAYGWY